MRPVIGLLPLFDEEKESYWMLPGYIRLVERCRGLPLILPPTTEPEALAQCAALCNGFLFTGGHDVSPALYGQTPRPCCGAPCPERDSMETQLLRLALEQKKAVLGICRGIQLINAVLGGTLYQDLPTEHPSLLEHHMSPPYDRSVHTVEICKGSLLEQLLGVQTLPVNSYHHQGICALAPGLEVDAVAPDGLIEAAHLPQHPFLLAVQWHPEFSYQTDPASVKLMQAFVDACTKE